MRRRVQALLAGSAVLAAAAGTSAVVLRQHAEAERAADRVQAAAVAEQFLRDWTERRYDAMTAATAAPDDPGSAYARTDQRLRVRSVQAVPGPLSPDGTTVPFSARLQLAGLGELAYDSAVHLVQHRGRWQVAFSSATLHPALAKGEQLQRRPRPGPRVQLADRRGTPLRAASADLAANVLGVEGETGLERVLDDELKGSGGGAVVVGSARTGKELRVVRSYAGRRGAPLRTTFDLRVQRAAERALAGLASPAALVAVDTRTGQVRAVADRPVAGAPAAFVAQAPGSVFKVVTATALLQAGLTPSSPAPCPDTTTSGGRPFRNDPGTVPGTLTLARAIAVSCNTAFLELAEGLPAGALAAAARLYGFDDPEPLLPILAQGGNVPAPRSTEEAAEDVIGQGRVQASPLLLASMVAAVADGAWHRPRLLPDAPVDERPLPAGVAASLRTMLRGVVTSGTGTAAQPPGGAPVSGKTGTAQYGSGDPLPTHAWFAGWQGELAFCVYVQNGSSGGGVATPVARQFLAALGP